MTVFELGYWQFLLWWTISLAAVGWVWVLFADERRKLWHDHHIGWWLWHWYTGGTLDTDRSLPHEGELAPYLAERAIYGITRTSGPAALMAALYATSQPTATPLQILAWGYGAAIGLGVLVLLVAHGAVRMALSMWWAQPLHEAICGFVGWDEDMAPRRYIKFDRVHELGLALTVYCPGHVKMTDTNVDNIVDAVGKKLGRDIEHVPDWEGQASQIDFRPPLRIPAHARFFDLDDIAEPTNIRRLIEAGGRDKILLGLAADGVPFWMDLRRDSPHFLISAGTGCGKSETLASIAAQVYWWGGDVYLPDLKRLSHIWTRGDLGGIHVAYNTEDINAMFVEVAGILEDRTRQCDPLQPGDDVPDFQPIALVVEELAALHAELEPSAKVALKKCLHMGRYLRIHVVACANQFAANLTGGGAAREDYDWRCLAGHSPQTAEMLAGKGHQVQPKTSEDRRGRAQIINGGDVTEIRRVFFDIDPREGNHGPDLVEWLRSSPHRQLTAEAATAKSFLKIVSPTETAPLLRTPQAPGHVSAVASSDIPSVVEIDAGSVLSRTDDGQGYVTLQEIVDLGIIPRALKTVRVYSGRSWFPKPAARGSGPYGHKYHEPAVRKAWAARPRIPENQDYYRPVVYAMVKGGRPVLEQALAGELTGVQAKVGYTFRDPGDRAKEVQMRPVDVVAVVDVEAPLPGNPLPDKAYHRDFWVDKVDKHDPDDEWFWVHPGGPVATWLAGVAA